MNLILKIIKIFPPEASHLIALNALNILHKLKLLSLLTKKYKNDEYIFGGITFSNRLGTAAGLDKNGDFIDCLGALGFGFIEVGTITPLPQPGNPKPRVFRLFDQNAVIGYHPKIKNFVFANGFSGHGFQQSPAIGRGVAELLTYEKFKTLDLSPFNFARIDSGAPFIENAII